MRIVRLTNQWDGSIAACERHIEEKAKYIYGTLTATVSDGACKECADERVVAEHPGKMRELLLSGTVTHTMARTWCGAEQVYIYVRDTTSPTGVHLGGALDAKVFDAMFHELRGAGLLPSSLSPLSPTEQR